MYTTIFCFFIYAFLGWCVEVIYATVNSGKFVNRGFLNGPYCPIYGCGVLIVTTCLTPVQENLVVLYLGSMLLTTLLELITGFLLARIFNEHWWDYSDEPFQLGGYICLKFSLLWGIACVIVMRLLHPTVLGLIRRIPHVLGIVLLIVFGIGFCADLAITILAILKIKKRNRLLSSIAAEMRAMSDQLGENLSDTVTDVMERNDKRKEKSKELRQEFALGQELTQIQLAELRERAEQLRERYRIATEQSMNALRHFHRAYPYLTHRLKLRVQSYLEEVRRP